MSLNPSAKMKLDYLARFARPAKADAIDIAGECLINLTPQTLEETEKYLYHTYKIYWEDLPHDFQSALSQLVREVSQDYMSWWGAQTHKQDCLDAKLKRFNEHQLQAYTDGILAHGKVCGTVNSDASLDFNIWVEFTGLTQKQADQLPKTVRAEIHEKFLKGYSEFRKNLQSDPELAQRAIERAIKGALEVFQGQKLTLRMLGAIKTALLNTGLIDECEGPIRDQNGWLFKVKVQTENGEYFSLDTRIN